MNILIIYLIAATSGWAIGRLQRQALAHQASRLLLITFFIRLTLLFFLGAAALFLHLSLLHLILNIILFWIISLIAFQ